MPPTFNPSDDPLFASALAVVMKHEGGFINDPDDPGGATKFGISLRWLKEVGELDLDGDGLPDGDLDLDGHIDLNDIEGLTHDNAAWFYKAHWWDRHRYGDFSLTIATKVFDLAVNMGSGQAHKCVQRASRACGRPLADDGILGPRTRAALADLDPKPLRAALCSEAAGFYRGLVTARPVSAKYLNGWLNRAYA